MAGDAPLVAYYRQAYRHPSAQRARAGSAPPRTVLVHGNCQAPYLALMLATLDDLNDDYEFVYVPNHPMPGESIARPVPPQYLHDVALLLSQFEGRSDNPATLALRAQLPAHCPELRFPSFIMNSLWPFECPEPRGQAEPRFPWKRYPLGDMVGLQVAQMGLAGPIAVAAYLDLSRRKMPDLKVRLQRDLERMQAYDQQCDIRLADYVLESFQREHLFWTAGHVSWAGVTELARRVAHAARPCLGGDAARMDACLRGAANEAGMGDHQHPIHPMVVDALGLAFAQADHTYRWYSQDWTFCEYIERYIAWDTDW